MSALSYEAKVGLSVVGALVVLALVLSRKSAASGCVPQDPQDFLIRGTYRATPGGLDAAIAYRTKEYGHVPGFGDASLNPVSPVDSSVTTTFFGIPVTLHRRVVASLRCVEQEILETCGAAYQPQALSGLRTKNTYVGGEVSNHMYGIALDIDPSLNPCCGCVGQWAAAPQCAKAVTSEFERMAMPECWVRVFEKYGWYWLGHDTLRDTMHFEFLGAPPALPVPRVFRRSTFAVVPDD